MITEYRRPATLEEAVAFVATPDASVIVEGAAFSSYAYDGATVAIDLQSLGLDAMEMAGETLRIGSMTRLADLSSSPLSPPIIQDLAHREEPSTIRNSATIGGVIATNDPESELLAGLIAFNASVAVTGADATNEHALETILADPQLIEDAVITAVSIETRGAAAAHRTGRTPMDRPIVMVVGHMGASGHIRLAVTGVHSHVVAMSPGQAGMLDPPADFRGTSLYRKTLATVLTKRVLADLSGGGVV
ncbi:MAG: FAD binding domain-containing protein [Actinomycetota bacterium]